jgi:DNA polymerase III sliding clamp (beta) subunit (PCNA family)
MRKGSISFNIYYIMEGLNEVITFNEEIPGSAEEGYTPIYRKKGVTKLHETPH